MAAIRRHRRALLLLMLLAGVLAILIAASHPGDATAILLAFVPVFLFEFVLTTIPLPHQPACPESLPRFRCARPALFQLPPPPIAA